MHKIERVPTNIRKARIIRHYSQRYLAAKLQVSLNTYSRIERGCTNIKLSKLLNIAEILEMDAVNLIQPRMWLEKAG